MLIILIINLIVVAKVECVTHWKITETGRIESNEDSMFTLVRPYDLAAFMKQANRIDRLDVLKHLLALKESITTAESQTSMPNSVNHYSEYFYSTDADCISAGQQLTKFSFYETHFITWRSENMHLPKEILSIKHVDTKIFKKPYCSNAAELPFTMGTFDHLKSIQLKSNISMKPEIELISNLIVDSEDLYGHLVYKSLNLNSTSWVYLTMASDYFRVKGDYENSISCLQRAIYYSPRHFHSIPMLSLSNMLHKLHYINDSLAIGLTSYSIDPKNSLLAYYLGNIYVTLGELNMSYTWYRKAGQLDPSFRQAILKKHAVACHIKLENYLEEQHLNLQKKLEELNYFQDYSEEWIQLNTKLDLEKSSSNRKKFTQNAYKEFLTNSKSTVCGWFKTETNQIRYVNCKNIPVHYSYFPFENQTALFQFMHKFGQDSNICNNIDCNDSRYHDKFDQVFEHKRTQTLYSPPA